jgi:fatty-acyl-CoA synthase
VATSEVSEAITTFPGIKEANVYGVAIAGRDGRAGMAALVVDGDLDLAALRAHVMGQLPEYARPLFLRIQSEIDVTGTFKQKKLDLVRQGFDPSGTTDPIYFNDPASQSFVRLDKDLYDRLQAGQVRV